MRASGRLHITLEVIRYGETVVSASRRPEDTVSEPGYKPDGERIEARYSSSGRGRPRYPVRAMLLALMLMYLLQMPSVTMLATQLDRHPEYRELCGFSGRSPDRTTFSKFITRAKPKTIEGVFRELRKRALKLGLYGQGGIDTAMDSFFIHSRSRRKRKAGVSDRGARVGRWSGPPTPWAGGLTP